MSKGPVLRVLGLALATYVCFCGFLYFFQENLIFLRRPLSESERRMTSGLPGTEELEIVGRGGVRLHGWLRHTGAFPIPGLVLYFGGNAEEVSNVIHDAPRLAPWSVAAFNYRGYGLSEGRPGEKALVADAAALFDALAARPDVPEGTIVPLGRSLGSGVAVQLAANRPVRAVMLVTPFESVRSIAKKRYPFVPVDLLLRHPFDSRAHAPALDVPLLVLAGERDSIIPAAHARRLAAEWGGSVQWELFPDTGHNDIGSEARYWPAMREFLAPLAPGS